jgi:Amidohydrolase family
MTARFCRAKRGFATLLMVLVGVAALSQQAALQTDGRVLAFTHVTVIDGTGGPPKSNQTVLLTRDRITTVGAFDAVRIPREARIVDATGRFLIPGLWDAHVHTRFEGIDHLRLLIANGVTSARNMSGPWEHIRQLRSWRDQIAKGERVGPRLLTSGPILDGPGTNRSVQLEISTPDEAREAVRLQKREGVDFIKVYDQLNRESYSAIAAEAKQQGLPFAGHVPFRISATEASDAGQQTLEHVSGGILRSSSTQEEQLRRRLDEGQGQRARFPFSSRELIESFSAEKVRALAERLRANHTVVVPSLSTCGNEGASAVDPDRLRYLPTAYVDAWKQVRAFEPVEDRRQRYELCQSIVRALDAAGVTMLAGTDGIMNFLIPGFSLQDELGLLVGAGLSEMHALQAATRNPAQAFKLTDQGTIESGMRADLVLLDANPLEHIENTRKIRAVVAGGRMFERGELDQMLLEIETAAKSWPGPATR